MNSVEDIMSFIESDAWLMKLCRAIQGLEELECWIAAGAIRNPIWAKLHGFEFNPRTENDVDVIYFDKSNLSHKIELEYEATLRRMFPEARWEVRNQAGMHLKNNDSPYESCANALEYWPETATSIAARLKFGKVELLAPCGVEDLLNLVVRQTPNFKNKRQIYEERVSAKGWRETWPLLTII